MSRRKGQVTDELRSRLRAAGLRATSARLAVLRRLIDARGPVSHGEVWERLRESGIDRATVYRNLLDLTDAGLARRGDLGDHVWRFELLGQPGEPDGDPHAHFVCNECGTVECLPDGSVSVRAVRGAPRALRGKSVSVQLSGVCDTCD